MSKTINFPLFLSFISLLGLACSANFKCQISTAERDIPPQILAAGKVYPVDQMRLTAMIDEKIVDFDQKADCG